MGKGKKRKNPGVGVDFRKVKHKVGKKLPKPQNETSTDFQARSINLPNQSITQDKAGAAVSERNLTLKELVSQLSHHNGSARRDALTGLQQLLTAHPQEARRHTALLLEALAPRLSDGEASVRSTLLQLLRCAVLPAIGPAALAPFLSILMAHLAAALTHLSADVRLDALGVLEVLTEAAPQLLVQQQQLAVALAHYTGLLSRANRGKSVRSQALSGLLKVVSSLERFLTAALGVAAAAGGSGSRNGSNAAATKAAAAAAGGAVAAVDAALLLPGGSSDNAGNSSRSGSSVTLMAARAAPGPRGAAELPTAADLLNLYCHSSSSSSSAERTSSKSSTGRKQQQQGSDQPAAAVAGGSGTMPAGSGGSGKQQQLQQQVLLLLDVLFDCWTEAAPGSLSSAPEQESAQVLVHILSSTQLLMAHLSPITNTTTTLASAAAAAGQQDCSTGRDAVHVSQHHHHQHQQQQGQQLLRCHGFDTQRDQVQWLQQAASIMLPKLLKVFPVSPPTTSSLSGSLQDLLQRFNLLSVKLLTGFMAAGVIWPPQQQQQQREAVVAADGSSVQQQQQQQEWQQRLLDFMAAVLSTGSCLPALEQQPPGSSKASSKGEQTAAAAAGTPTAAAGRPRGVAAGSSSLSSSSMLVAVLDSLRQLLPYIQLGPRQQLLAAVGQLAAAAADPKSAAAAGGSTRSPDAQQQQQLTPAAAGAAASNAVRIACLQLQLQLMLQALSDGSSGSSSSSPEQFAQEQQAMSTWLAVAPKLLWQCGSSKPRISHLLLQLLYTAARLSGPGSLLQEQLQQQQPQMAALLATALPPAAAAPATTAKPSKQKRPQPPTPSSAAAAAAPQAAAVSQQSVSVLVGPLAALPGSCQALAFDTLAYQTQFTPPLLKAAVLCCRISSYNDAAVQRLLDGLLSAAAGNMPPDVYISFVATVLSPGPSGGYLDRTTKKAISAVFARHQQLVDAVCRWLHAYGPVPELLQLLVPSLVQQWQQQQQQEQGQQQQQMEVLCCLSYSLASLAALGIGCWVPSTTTTSSSSNKQKTAAMAAPAAGGAVQMSALTHELLEAMPAVLAVQCFTRSSTSGDGNAFAAEAAVDNCLQLLVLPLVTTLQEQLLISFLQHLLAQCLAGEHQQQHGLQLMLHVMRVLFEQQSFRVWLLEVDVQMQAVLRDLVGAARRLQQQSGDSSRLSEVEQLQTALAVICGR